MGGVVIEFVSFFFFFYVLVWEVDILWEKCVWWVIDICEKINFIFWYLEKFLFNVLVEGMVVGEVFVYSLENDKFLECFDSEEVWSKFNIFDIVMVVDFVMNEFIM